MSINLDRIGWQDGTLVSKAKVEVNGVIYDVEPEQYSGQTPLSSANLKKMEENTEKAINEVDTELNNKITNLTTYSTEEVKTGETWIDGKPIYRKTYSFTIPTANQEKLIAHNIENVENIWLSNKSFLKTEDNCIPVNHYRDSGAYIWCLANSHDIRIKTGASGWTNNTTYVTIEYTKTTD